MSINKKNDETHIIDNNDSKKDPFIIYSSSESCSNNDTHKKIKSYSELNFKEYKDSEPTDNVKYTTTSTAFQTFSRANQTEGENDLSLGERIKNEYSPEISSNEYEFFGQENLFNEIIPSKKPRLSLKDSRTKLKQLRDKLYPLTIEERIKEQENLLPVPLNKMNDSKYKILKMQNLKKKSLPEYKT